MREKNAGTDYTEILEEIHAHQDFVVVSHARPDGDAIGSTIAMGLALQAMGKRVRLWNEHNVPQRFAFLRGAERIQPTPDTVPADVEAVICLDTGAWKRLGDRTMATLEGFPLLLNIDHHETNERYANVNHVEGESAATGFVLYGLFKAMGVEITPAIADALYAAVSTDTGSFQFSSTTPGVMHMAAHLLECGVDVGDINRRLYQEQPLTAYVMQKEVLNNMVVECCGMLSHYSMPAGTKARLGIGLDDTKDLVDIIRPLQGVKIAIIFEDTEDGRIRMSLRSKDPRVNVAEFAARFGGGGHAMAAGIRIRGTLEECREKVLAAARATLNALQ